MPNFNNNNNNFALKGFVLSFSIGDLKDFFLNLWPQKTTKIFQCFALS